jgi:tRNA(Arg) A34 adenosine deaminase TadA
MTTPLRPYDEALLRLAFDVAKRAREGGDHPFGSVLADGEGNLLMEQGNGYSAAGNDRTAHAESLLASRAARAYDLAYLAKCTLYTSAEPCAMCAGAIYWAGIGRVVYGQTEKALKAQTGAHEENPTLDLPCDVVFAAGQRPTEVVGPLLEDEAAQLQADFWRTRG